MNETTYICSECGAILSSEEAHEFEGQFYCDNCLDDLTIICDCCSKRIFRDNAEGTEYITLCSRCYDDCYTTCDECGCLIHNSNVYYSNDSDYGYCESCYERIKEKPIHSYSYKPEPLFYGAESELYMGIELEIDKGGEIDENAEELINLANCSEERIYCKHDGSLSDGFEIVSHPMSLVYHTQKMNWEEIFEKAIEMHYASHNTCTCGFHIHCNRDAFGKDTATQDARIGRLIYFTERHWDELVRFSRRSVEALDRWAARYATISNTTQETYKKAKEKRMGRYVAINLENNETIEFRLFRGTLRYETFIATLQLVSEICRLAITMTDNQMESLSWCEFVSRIDNKKYPELIAYLKSKRLYVNVISDEIEEE